MVKVRKGRCAMCGKKLTGLEPVADGEYDFCDNDCRNWFKSTYGNEEVKIIDKERVDNSMS